MNRKAVNEEEEEEEDEEMTGKGHGWLSKLLNPNWNLSDDS